MRTEARKWEISENLHRADLTALERADQTAEWIELTNQERKDKPAQLGPVSKKGGRGNTGGVNAAVRELDIKRTQAQRAVKIATISSKAKAAIREAPSIRNNQSALLRIASLPADKQLAAVSAPMIV